MDSVDILIDNIYKKLKISGQDMYPIFEPNQKPFYDVSRTEDDWEPLNSSIWVRCRLSSQFSVLIVILKKEM